MKKLLAMLLVLAMLLCLCACGGNNEEPIEDEMETPVETDAATQDEPEVPAVTGDITMEALMSAPESPAEDFTVIDHDNGVIELLGYTGDDEIVVIPESLGITQIASYVFANSSPVKAIRISNTVTSIEMGAFGLNENLELVVCGDSVEVIGEGAFQNCVNLREIILSEKVTLIEDAAFSGCEKLKSIEIPASVTEIEMLAFYPAPEGFTIIGEAGSVAEEHANSEGIAFESK